MTGFGSGLIVTDSDPVAEQPKLDVCVTVRLPVIGVRPELAH